MFPGYIPEEERSPLLLSSMPGCSRWAPQAQGGWLAWPGLSAQLQLKRQMLKSCSTRGSRSKGCLCWGWARAFGCFPGGRCVPVFRPCRRSKEPFFSTAGVGPGQSPAEGLLLVQKLKINPTRCAKAGADLCFALCLLISLGHGARSGAWYPAGSSGSLDSSVSDHWWFWADSSHKQSINSSTLPLNQLWVALVWNCLKMPFAGVWTLQFCHTKVNQTDIWRKAS